MAQTELKRQIGLFDAVMLISGDMIGTGIFISTGVIAAQVLSPGGVLLVWILAGLLALTGALSCAELSASLPYAGGDYNYIREAYGKLMGFLSGWSSFLVTFSGAIAFLAVIFNEYMSFFFPVLGSKEVLFSAAIPLISINITIGTLFCIFVVLAISTLHCIGVRQGTVTQNILTVIKIGSPMKEILNHYRSKIDASNVLSRLGLVQQEYFVVSAHREENVDSPENFNDLLDSLVGIAQEFGRRGVR